MTFIAEFPLCRSKAVASVVSSDSIYLEIKPKAAIMYALRVGASVTIDVHGLGYTPGVLDVLHS